MAVSSATTVVVEAPRVENLTPAGTGSATNVATEETFTPTAPALGTSQEVFGKVGIAETSRGDVRDLAGNRVAFIHDPEMFRVMEDVLLKLEEIADLLRERA